MEIRAGWATNYGEIKYDVSTDEGDLARILLAGGISPSFHGKLTAEEAWTLLDAEARWLAEHAKARYLEGLGNGEAAEAAAERARLCVKDRLDALGALRKRLGLEGPQSRAQLQSEAGADGSH